MTQPLTLAGTPPTQPTHAVPKSYVDDQVVPIGTIWMFAGQNVPSGWAVCDGSTKTTTDPAYAGLFSVIGYTYGGSGTSFVLPNLKGRFPIGRDPGDAAFDVLNDKGGSKDQTIILPHQHNTPGASVGVGNHNHYAAHRHGMSHQHSVPFRQGYAVNSGGQPGMTNAIYTPSGTPLAFISRATAIWTGEAEGGPDQVSGLSPSTTDWDDMEANSHYTGNSGGHTVTVPGGTTSGGPSGNGAGANLPPYITLNFIIRIGL